MAVTVTPTPAAPINKVSFTKFAIAGLTLNDATTQAEVRYYLQFVLGGVVKGTSQRFACDHDGGWLFDNYLFSEAGAWSVLVKKDSDDTTVKTQAVTVS